MEHVLYAIERPPGHNSHTDGRLDFRYSLKGVTCSRCATVTASQRVAPLDCPSEITREVDSLYEKPCLTTTEFHLVLSRWEQLVGKSHPFCSVNPGTKFAQAVWYREVLTYDDFYWPTFGPVCSKPVAAALTEAHVLDVTFRSLTVRRENQTYTEDEPVSPIDILPIANYVRNGSERDTNASNYSLLITHRDTCDTVEGEFGGFRCEECGAARIPVRRENEYRRSIGIARSKMRVPIRWVIDSDVFRSPVFPGGMLVTPRVNELLIKASATGFRVRKVLIET